MLENPVYPTILEEVKICLVRTTSRQSTISREPQRLHAELNCLKNNLEEIVRSLWRHKETNRNVLSLYLRKSAYNLRRSAFVTK